MKLKQEFVMREVAGETLLIPITGINDAFDGIITLNETSAFIWKQIEEGKEKEEIVKALLEVYDVEEAHVKENVDDFCAELERMGIL